MFLVTLGLYAASAGVTLRRGSLAPHYVYLAYSLLRGHVDLVALPPVTYDLLAYQGKWFVAGSPLPAVLLMPFVALWGLGVSDIPFGVVVGAVSVALMYDLLNSLAKVSGNLGKVPTLWLTALFAAGTVHWYVAVIGSYWFNAHVVTVLFVMLYARETLGRGRGWCAGLWLALAGLARPTALFAAPFFITWAWMQRCDQSPLPLSPTGAGQGARLSFLNAVTGFGAVLALGVGAHLAYNAMRFGSPLEFGYAYAQGAENITSAYARYGGFNLYFVPFNLYVSLLGPPDVSFQFPFVQPNPWGMSILLTTPAFLYLFRAFRRESVVVASWVGLLGVMIPLWMYHNTGSMQFGYRYSLDAAPFLMLLAAIGMRGPINWPKRALIIASILINWAGMTWMFAHFQGFDWVGMWARLVVR